MSNQIDRPFSFRQGNSSLLVSMPHSGTVLLPEMEKRLTEAARNLPDTDWYLPELYDFLNQMDVSVIHANYSRYVIDLNRPVDDKPLYAGRTTGLFPEILFSDQAVFLEGQQFDEATKSRIKAEVWLPYHQKIGEELQRIQAQHGYAILFDAHSIAAQVPMLFDGTLPDFNFGNNDGHACPVNLMANLADIVCQSSFSHVCNGRFKGGYITRHFGQPEHHIHAIQLELSQATYLADRHQDQHQGHQPDYQLDHTKKQRVGAVLHQLIEALLAYGQSGELKLGTN
ncbi:N-formylglutamate deformylase [Vibrio mangrovi]|uniref:N-formylglutamate amidohydrolase n=1 Tax=Vibrio mangrovi TaxID=474394 RepID=A0A1Y6IUE9_9VIBR|nr:N-formylglutamate deformylase [Vibrio mangrovi]MDW6003534.1 N-formylglutamate deformylase [Vibrio mangrovi]SMR99673.1 N-formylglutamate amidohydrolase [Vibrio mangrovi]